MKELYHVEGTLNKGFVGQITYMVCLDKPCTEMDIHLTYDYAELRYQDDKMTPTDVIEVYLTPDKRSKYPLITTPLLREFDKMSEEDRLNHPILTPEVFRECLEAAEKNRRNYPEITPEVLKNTIAAIKEMSGSEIDEEKARKILIYDIDLKTEIHPLAMLNDEFIGCIHKQLPDRHMIFKGEEVSHGCIPQEKFEGVLKITLLVFNVAKDNTHYTLTVSGQ